MLKLLPSDTTVMVTGRLEERVAAVRMKNKEEATPCGVTITAICDLVLYLAKCYLSLAPSGIFVIVYRGITALLKGYPAPWRLHKLRAR